MATIYGTRVEADAYFGARGVSDWGAASEPARDAALVRGSLYVDGRYRSRFPGRKAGGRAQEREWPRTGATDTLGDVIAADEIPQEIVAASYEAALRELAAPGSLSPDVVAGQLVKREKVEGAVEIEYVEASGADAMRPVISIIDDLLSGLLSTKATAAAGSASFLLRA